jgi:hypothetical protein
MDNLPVCIRCQQVHRNPSGGPSCKAHNARSLRPCKAYPVPGGTVCVTHGGKTQALSARVVQHRNAEYAEYAANMLGLVDFEISPTEALLQEVRESAANVAFLRARVQAVVGEEDLDDPTHPLIWGQTTEKQVGASQFPGTDEEYAPGVNIWYQMYQSERERMVRAAQMALRAGVEERRVRLAEMGADVIVGRIRQILNALDLTPSQLQSADIVVPAQIAALAQDLEAAG